MSYDQVSVPAQESAISSAIGACEAALEQLGQDLHSLYNQLQPIMADEMVEPVQDVTMKELVQPGSPIVNRLFGLRKEIDHIHDGMLRQKRRLDV